MFDRRQTPNWGNKLLGFFWPAMGWRRTVTYMFHRISRLQGTSYAIAGGFACGAAASFTPFVGLHFILGAILAWIIRCNIIASAIGTAVGNPWTFPFIWTWLFELGRWMGAGSDVDGVEALEVSAIFGNVLESMLNGDMSAMVTAAGPVFWPMLLASVPTSVAVWFAFYIPLKSAIERCNKRTLERRSRRSRTVKENGI